MADEQHEDQQEQQGEQRATTDDTQDSRLQEALDAIEALKRKNQELLGEKKSASQKARELEEQKAQAERERMEQDGQHKELSEKYKTEAERYQAELADLRRGIATEKLSNKAAELAGEYASDTRNAKLLSKFLKDELDYVDGAVVARNHASIDDLIKSMEQSGDYASLWKGKASSGGGATGQKGGSAATKKLSELSESERTELAMTEPDTFARLMAEAKNRRG
jgi:DNA repair exonuclease SbcCD ATPase subunit